MRNNPAFSSRHVEHADHAKLHDGNNFPMYGAWYKSSICHCNFRNLPDREELSFFNVCAFPKASLAKDWNQAHAGRHHGLILMIESLINVIMRS